MTSLNCKQAPAAAAPCRLLVVCGVQTLLLLCCVYVGAAPSAACAVVVRNQDVAIDCHRCETRHSSNSAASIFESLLWYDVVMLVLGFVVIAVGVYAAVSRSVRCAKLYGCAMLLFAFLVGLLAAITGLQAPILAAARRLVLFSDATCAGVAQTMIDSLRLRSVVYGAFV